MNTYTHTHLNRNVGHTSGLLFLIPATMCEEIERKMNAFLWGNGPNSRGVRWMSWEKVCMPKNCGGLGLKELRKFNLSMLAKQGWRLLTEANPLVSAVMRARYYPDSNLLDATLGSNPSYVWRSIMSSMEVVKAGARRKIGDGRSTRVWGDPWLPDVTNGYIMTPMPVQLQESMVFNLMKMDERRWELDILHDSFQDRDTALIKQIPLPIIETADSWYWILDEKGDFIVKSGYRWLQGEIDTVDKRYWTKLWSLSLPCKVVNFLWRVCRGCLPTAYALVTKHVDINVLCPWCHHAPETDTHVLFSCDFARTVWHMAGLSSMVQHSSQESAATIIRRVFDSYSREQCVQMGMIGWGLWKRRNNWVWNKANGSAFGVLAASSKLQKEWEEAQVRGVRDRKVGGLRKWGKPNEGWIKVNVDAAVFRDSIGCGAVIRNAQGVFMGAMCKTVEGAWRPREAEAIALKEALSWIADLGHECCVFESDSRDLVQACRRAPDESRFGTIVGDCLHLLKHIKKVLVQFAFRSVNSVAHELARATHSMSGRGEWYVTPPEFLSRVLEFDMVN